MVQDTEFLPGQDIATLFYQKYEPREVLGKGASSTVRRCLLKGGTSKQQQPASLVYKQCWGSGPILTGSSSCSCGRLRIITLF